VSHILQGEIEIDAIGELGVGGGGDGTQGEGAGTLEEARMFHRSLSGARRDMGQTRSHIWKSLDLEVR
jgi:hypothetical protein